jgi:broad specificity phosphatase PhoE
MPRNLYLVRHAECASLRQTDDESNLSDEQNALTESGWQQAAALGAALSRLISGPVRIMASDLRRAVETSTAVGRALGLTVEYDERLRERDFGDVTQISTGQLRELQAMAHAAPRERIRGAESVAEHFARVRQALCELLSSDDRDVIVIAHGGTLDCLQLHLYGSDADGAAFRYSACEPARGHHWQLRRLSAERTVACLISVNSTF